MSLSRCVGDVACLGWSGALEIWARAWYTLGIGGAPSTSIKRRGLSSGIFVLLAEAGSQEAVGLNHSCDGLLGRLRVARRCGAGHCIAVQPPGSVRSGFSLARDSRDSAAKSGFGIGRRGVRAPPWRCRASGAREPSGKPAVQEGVGRRVFSPCGRPGCIGACLAYPKPLLCGSISRLAHFSEVLPIKLTQIITDSGAQIARYGASLTSKP